MKGIQDIISLSWNNTSIEPNPGIPTNDVIDKGISAPVVLDPQNNRTNSNLKLMLMAAKDCILHL